MQEIIISVRQKEQENSYGLTNSSDQMQYKIDSSIDKVTVLTVMKTVLNVKKKGKLKTQKYFQ